MYHDIHSEKFSYRILETNELPDIVYIHSACFLTIIIYWRRKRELTGVHPTTSDQQRKSGRLLYERDIELYTSV